MKPLCTLSLLALLLALAQPPLAAQEESGIYGVVRSQSSEGLLGAPVTGAAVAALDSDDEVVARAVTEYNGAYRLVVPPGSYRLVAAHLAYRDFDTGGTVLLVQHGHFTLFNIGMEPKEPGIGGVRGVVVSADGDPVAEAAVLLFDDTGERIASSVADAEGSYAFELPTGSYSLVARHPDHGESAEEKFDLVGGETTFVDLILRAPPEAKGGFQGLIRARADGGSAGRPIPGATVTAVSEDGQLTRTASANDIGFYKLNLPPGSYRLSASHPDFEPVGSGGETVGAEDETVRAWNALLAPRAPLTDAPICRDRFPLSVGQTYGERHTIFLRVRKQGVISVVYRWSGDTTSLALIVRGPDGVPLRVDGRSPLRLTAQVRADILALGSQWELSVRNFSGGRADGTLTITYPCEK